MSDRSFRGYRRHFVDALRRLGADDAAFIGDQIVRRFLPASPRTISSIVFRAFRRRFMARNRLISGASHRVTSFDSSFLNLQRLVDRAAYFRQPGTLARAIASFKRTFRMPRIFLVQNKSILQINPAALQARRNLSGCRCDQVATRPTWAAISAGNPSPDTHHLFHEMPVDRKTGASSRAGR